MMIRTLCKQFTANLSTTTSTAARYAVSSATRSIHTANALRIPLAGTAESRLLQKYERRLTSSGFSRSFNLLSFSSSSSVSSSFLTQGKYATQVACYRTNFRRPGNWVVRRGGGFDENLTGENKQFLEQVLVDKYTNAESPLKQGPWKRGEFNPEIQ